MKFKEAKNYLDIVKSKEYKQKLSEMSKRIVKLSKIAPNEATIESNFDCELFAFFRENFSKFGFAYNPIKEKTVDSQRNILNGRADTSVATLIIEFKQPKTLNNEKQKNKALEQISDYMITISESEEQDYEGFVTDGVNGCFLRYKDGKVDKENFYDIDAEVLDRIIQNILAVNLIGLNSKNLVNGLCNPPDYDGEAFRLMFSLYKTIENGMQPKTQIDLTPFTSPLSLLVF